MIVWLASYPRSGNTFFRIILNTVFNIHTYSIHNNFKLGQQTSDIVGHTVLPDNFDIDTARQSEEVYYIKTHAHYDEKIAPEDRVIYLIRDGRESSLSYTKYQNTFGKRNKILLDTINGDTSMGGWGEHVLSWEKFPRERILYIYFETLTDRPSEQIGKIAEFLAIKPNNNIIPTFEELKAINPKFFRSGKKDSWRDAYSEEEHIAFWHRHGEAMKKYGYTHLMPKMFDDL
ncbi:MAG: sulfotransferase domain-containing protein [Sulfurovaceae bacterium]